MQMKMALVIYPLYLILLRRGYANEGFPGGANCKAPACQCRRCKRCHVCRRCKRCHVHPWVGKIPWRRAWQSTPVFLPGVSHGQRSLVGYIYRVTQSRTWLKWHSIPVLMKGGIPDGTMIKNLPASAEDAGSMPGSGRSPGEGNGNPLQNSYLGNAMDRGAWQATVHGVAKGSGMT